MRSPPSQPEPLLADEFAALWAADQADDVFRFLASRSGAAPTEQLDVLLIDQAERRRRSIEIPVEKYSNRSPPSRTTSLSSCNSWCVNSSSPPAAERNPESRSIFSGFRS